MTLEELAQAIRYLALLQEVQASENGVAEMYRVEEGGLRQPFWRCKYCHGPYTVLSCEHTKECPFQAARSWRKRIVQALLPMDGCEHDWQAAGGVIVPNAPDSGLPFTSRSMQQHVYHCKKCNAWKEEPEELTEVNSPIKPT